MILGPVFLWQLSGCTSYEAVFDFKAEQSTHLSLKQGDHVRVNRKETAGWWRGTVGDQTGWFPSNYVQPALQGLCFFLTIKSLVELKLNYIKQQSFKV